TIVIGSPFWLAIAAAIKITSPGPVFFRDVRIGLGERPFGMMKFRTMYADARDRQAALEGANEASGPLFKIKNDPRVTPVGRFLRRFSIDELPQVLNVLWGEMSLVGPRPLPIRDYEQLEPWHRKRYSVLPGMTGLWQVSGRIELSFDDLVRLDFYYLENWSIWLDISILAKTLPAVLARRGAYCSSKRPPALPAAVSRRSRRADLRTKAQLSSGHNGSFTLACHNGSVKAPKILAVASAADLSFRYGCTPAWWQLWKGLYEAGADLIVTTYRGRPVESPWWRTAPNPAYREGEAYARVRDLAARLRGDRYLRRAESDAGDTDRLQRELIWRWVTPRWRRHLERILEREGDVEAVVVFTVPMAHFRGIPTALRDRFGVPVVFYDGDVPMSLPEHGGMDTGFNYYHGADPSEYDLVVSNSEGGLGRLRELGARRAEAVFWAADPDLFTPLAVEKEMDVFFYGYGDKFRREWTA